MTWLGTHFLVVCISLAMALSSLTILGQRRSPQATLAWLLFLVLLPYVALPVFLLLGFRKRAAGVAVFAERPDPRLPERSASRLGAFCDRFGFRQNSQGNAFRSLPDPVEAWQSLENLVHGAETSLDVTLYVLGPDDVGQAFCAALEVRARAGVRVRVILDSIGSFRRPKEALRNLSAAGAEVRLYSPLVQWPTGGHLNLRNHRKMIIADGRRVWTGGRNVAAEYLGPTEINDRWRDLSCMVTGPLARRFSQVFEADWAKVGGSTGRRHLAAPDVMGQSAISLLPSGPDMADDALHDALLVACHETKSRLWIVTPYFLPTPSLMEALSIATRRGVDVRVLLPIRSNQRLADLARGPWLRDLEKSGVHFHLHPHMVHAKAVLTDNAAFVGSANFDARSLLLNYEAMLLLESGDDIAATADWARQLHAEAPEGLPDARLWHRMIESIFRLFTPVL